MSSGEIKTMEFEYKIIAKSNYLFISLKGKISRDSKDAFEDCLKKILEHRGKTIVLLMKDIHSIDFAMGRDFTLFQHEVRTKNNDFFLVGLKMQVKENLNNRGLLRASEVRNTLEDVIGFKVA
jgi:anti-anti-sigma factor